MSNNVLLSHSDIDDQVALMAKKISTNIGYLKIRCYPIPRGGVPVAYLLSKHLLKHGVELTIEDLPENADIFIDDIVDSGRTRDAYINKFPHTPFYSLYVGDQENWLVFPWDKTTDSSIDDAIMRIKQFCRDRANEKAVIDKLLDVRIKKLK